MPSSEVVSALFAVLPFVMGLAFWVWMLVDCLKNEPSEGNGKIAWALVIIVTGCVGAVIYFFFRWRAQPKPKF